MLRSSADRPFGPKRHGSAHPSAAARASEQNQPRSLSAAQGCEFDDWHGLLRLWPTGSYVDGFERSLVIPCCVNLILDALPNARQGAGDNAILRVLCDNTLREFKPVKTTG